MRGIYSNLPAEILQKLAETVALPIAGHKEEADVLIYLYQGADTPEISQPVRTLLIVPVDQKGAMEYIDQATRQGVAETNLFLLQPGQKISTRSLQEKILAFKSQFPTDPNYQQEPNKPKQTRIIALLSFKGGVGLTTLATALTFHYANCGEKVALVDLGEPPYTVYYMAKPPLAEGNGYRFARTIRGDIYIPHPIKGGENLSPLLEKLQGSYDRVIIDCPPLTGSKHPPVAPGAMKILLVDYDLRTLEQTAEMLKQTGLVQDMLVANRIPRVYIGTYGAVAEDILGMRPQLEIPADAEGCQAVLDQYRPVNDDRGSEILAARIGEMAALLNQIEMKEKDHAFKPAQKL
ncbi:hypothetical protein [Desulforamulus ruminis]|uniref:CobQ/CobB/MinD/ParA nucleotide binding domain-containing protein n=1 Tax=Desulforamulus ruminis (strain ATCC 23193 / DSM 2154 / NCIMB 8452 / DL) TaxID=696281 RepID=F6DTC7_DESRL|nr:hypothetical protein [Desulforamulus ruminis]AEG58944.1 hypothetical protein Desru_0659 [Desulforamulus ruminis DSM 2154]